MSQKQCQFATATYEGMRRTNQDSLYPRDKHGLSRNGVFVVSDGHGQNGDKYSGRAVEILVSHLEDLLREGKQNVPETIVSALKDANSEFYAANLLQHGLQRKFYSGATVAVAFLQDRLLYYTSVGDSRIYLSDGDAVTPITRDDSYAQRLVDVKDLSPENAKVDYRKNELTKALGKDESMDVGVIKKELAGIDALLLCTDGLSGMLTDNEIKSIMQNSRDIHQAREILLERANKPQEIVQIYKDYHKVSEDEARKRLLEEQDNTTFILIKPTRGGINGA